jgi:hypothetical protein
LPADSNQPAENPRRRIVIPLGSGKKKSRPSVSQTVSQDRTASVAPPAKRSRLVRILGVLALLLVVIVIVVAGGIFFWWQHYKTTPSYSLAVLVDAGQRNDLATVQSLVDTDQVVKNFTGEVIDKAASRYGMALGDGGREKIQALASTFVPRLKESVNAALGARIKEISEKAEHKPFILVALGLPYFVNVDVTGDNAKATVQVRNQAVELDLSRSTDGWKVIGYHDEVLVQRAIDQVIKDLPAVGGDRKPAPLPKLIKGLPPLRIR